jgi:hypothetical protein
MRVLFLFLLFLVFNAAVVSAQTITSFFPTSATTGTHVTITGTNLNGATAVRFNGVQASSFTVVNSTTIIAVVGAGASGNVEIVKGGTFTRSGFTYYVPTPTASWPFSFLLKPTCSNPTLMPGVSCTKWPVSNGSWSDASTWNNGTVPRNMDIVCIPAGRTVYVSGKPYPIAGNSTTVCPVSEFTMPRLFIFVCGTLDFDQNPAGKLELGCQSAIQVWPGGLINSRGGNAELIQVGSKVVWRDNNQDLPGPYYLNDGCGPLGCVGNGVLSVHFSSIKAVQREPYKLDIQWSTSIEQQTVQFVVERSSDQQNWETIGVVPARGNSQVIQNYTFTDVRPKPGVNFYRVREIDQSGQGLISDIARATVERKEEFSLYPNPVKDQASLYCQGGFQNGTVIKVFNQNGVFVQQFRTGNADVFKWDIRDYRPGLYLLQIQDVNTMQVKTIKMIRQ